MRLKRKILVMFAYLMASKHAIAAAGGTAITAAALSHDWLTWAVSALGSVAYSLRNPEVKKLITISNSIISVGLGGLGAPWLVNLVLPNVPSPPVYLASFLVALLWPYMWGKYMKKDES